jgi:hypothetical protein
MDHCPWFIRFTDDHLTTSMEALRDMWYGLRTVADEAERVTIFLHAFECILVYRMQEKVPNNAQGNSHDS